MHHGNPQRARRDKQFGLSSVNLASVRCEPPGGHPEGNPETEKTRETLTQDDNITPSFAKSFHFHFICNSQREFIRIDVNNSLTVERRHRGGRREFGRSRGGVQSGSKRNSIVLWFHLRCIHVFLVVAFFVLNNI